jgi:hypothetical protein
MKTYWQNQPHQEPVVRLATHHDVCLAKSDADLVDSCLNITVGHRADGTLVTTVRFASGEKLVAEAGDPDLGFSEPHTVLHDVTHSLLACLLGLDRSPVLERVVELRALSQVDVDIEEAATFAIQAFCHALRGEDPGAAIANVRTALDRSFVPA